VKLKNGLLVRQVIFLRLDHSPRLFWILGLGFRAGATFLKEQDLSRGSWRVFLSFPGCGLGTHLLEPALRRIAMRAGQAELGEWRIMTLELRSEGQLGSASGGRARRPAVVGYGGVGTPAPNGGERPESCRERVEGSDGVLGAG
jgi:hypothetical protein